MIRNYFKSAFRQLGKRKLTTAINILGLSLSMTCGLVIFEYIRFEKSFDTYHPKAASTYRIARKSVSNGMDHYGARTGVPLAEGLKSTIPQVLDATRVWGGQNSLAFSGMILCLDGSCHEETNIMFADPNFFDFFGIEMLNGDPKTALSQPNSMIITEAMGLKYFGDNDPIGKVLKTDHGSGGYKITAVVEDVPDNTHFSFDFLLSFNSLDVGKSANWNSGITYAYVQLDPKADLESVQMQVQSIFKANIDPKSEATLFLQRVMDIHLESNLNSELEANGNVLYIRLLSIAGILILVIGAVNFINLSGAGAWDKALETGIRKVFGARRTGVLVSFFFDAAIVVTATLVIVVMATKFIFQYINAFLDLELGLGVISMIFLLSYALILTFLGSLYPSLLLFSVKIQTALKRRPLKVGSKFNRRDRLIIVQFMLAVALIISASIIGDQLSYIQQKKLGFSKERLLVINNAEAIPDLGSFKSNLLRNPNVQAASRSNTVLGKWLAGPFTIKSLSNAEQIVHAWPLFVDDTFLEVYGINVAAGRGFSSNTPTSQHEAIINKRLLDGLDLADIEGLGISFFGKEYNVVGLIEDVHYQSLHKKIEPLVMLGGDQSFGQRKKLTVKLGGKNMSAAIAQTRAQWESILPGVPFNYTFFDDDFARLYDNEATIHGFSRVFGIVSVIIAGIGLFALSLFTAQQKKREIAIRKVLGASLIRIIGTLTTRLGALIVLAFVLAIPLTVFAMNTWLENFENRISLKPAHFALGLGVLLLTVGLSTSQLLHKAIKNNPIDNLKEE